RAAALAARAGAEATKDMVAQRGRARFTPGGGRGHQDPGATSMALVWETLAEVAEEL
ncbi:MAG: DAK2 domain-containing protein, partial [Deinococcus sp.]|nr:DAK2 domain-containing protein [Deinococcus sp.]